ncbi:zona pellucida sperm-binding protein 3-like isoform X1 [Hippoglossus hippoglossus]|uniref:zona pellucida sperm-binding protein 3-like isoform X1 n=1 Tax=Hippoglossus hippoglossus TaxID=8267 RepID=UPI00148E2ECC|nr:zona pellucida sperm-binding protein 3-like isoform X1 [Hippoglossus hippoglossus]
MRLQPSVANHAACVKMAVLLQFTGLHLDFLAVALSVSASSFAMGTRDSSRLEIRCGEAEVRVTVQRRLLEERRVPFRREHLRLGAKPTRGQEASCGPRGLMTGEAAVISAGLRDCGAESRVHGEWLVYSNQLFLFPAVISTSSGSVIVRAATTIIPVECHYNRKQTVNADALTPTWQPMTSTIGVFGLLHFSLRTMADDCNSLRSSSVYQQGEAVFLEASVEAPLHPLLTVYVDYCVATLKPDPLSSPSYRFITNYGCLVDSVLPGSSSKFLLREQENRLCFSVQAFHFKQDSGEQMFISCHLRATLKPNSQSHLNKACFFHRPTFRWRATEGDQALCECCDSDDCLRQTGVGNIGYTVHTTPPHKETTHEADTTVGPLHTLPPSHWTGHLSVSH